MTLMAPSDSRSPHDRALAIGALDRPGGRGSASPRAAPSAATADQVAASFPLRCCHPLVTMGLLAAHIHFMGMRRARAPRRAMVHPLQRSRRCSTRSRRTCARRRTYGLGGWIRWRTLYLPAVFPHLVTGLITAAGGAWNASIVSEYVRFHGRSLVAPGLGSLITQASEAANFALLAAGVLTMSFALVVLNRTVWRRLYRLADERFSLNR